MNFSPDEVLQYVSDEDVKFVRMAFCDVFGRQKDVAIVASQLPRAFRDGIALDASSIDGFDMDVRSDLFLIPHSSTLTELPWRPQRGRVAHMFCSVVQPDGTSFNGDTRHLLEEAVDYAAERGYTFSFGTEMEFYLFKLNEDGYPTKIPFDQAGYMDVAPEDKGENVRREICLTLEQMGVRPESSHHESGPGQNEIDFRYADPVSAADNAIHFRSIVRTIAAQHGLYADFSARPLENNDGSGMHINVSARFQGKELAPEKLVPGLMDKIRDMTLFLNPTANSYSRLGRDKAPSRVTWSAENRSQLIRVPAAKGEYKRLELRSPDPTANPYLAFALIIYAAIEGIEKDLPLPEPVELNLFTAESSRMEHYTSLPVSISEAASLARSSAFIQSHIPDRILTSFAARGV